MINPLRYILSQGSKVPCLRPMFVFIMVLCVLVEIPCDCKMRAKGLIIHDKRRPGSVYATISYSIFKQLARKSNAWHKVEETQ